jgi:hypothetical protein
MENRTMKSTILLVLLFWCLAASGRMVSSVLAAEEGTFSGTWSANGIKEVLSLGGGREAATFYLNGNVRLTNKIGQEKEYWSECIGFADSAAGSDICCKWRGLSGEEIYLTMKGTKMATGSSVTGNIIGGTDSAKGVTGTVRFTWSMMTFQQVSYEIGIAGYSNDVSGTYKLP